MATLKCLSSGSQGNCYLLECNNEVLIIELGVSWKEVLKGLNYDLSKVVGVLVSHSHRPETTQNLYQPQLKTF